MNRLLPSASFLFFAILNFDTARCQESLATPSKLTFDNNVEVPFEIIKKHGSTVYQMTEKSFQVMKVQSFYLTEKNKLNDQANALLQKEVAVKDSALSILEHNAQQHEKRANLYHQGYLQLKTVTTQYDSTINEMYRDLERAHLNDRKIARQNFVKGACAGVGLAVFVVLITNLAQL